MRSAADTIINSIIIKGHQQTVDKIIEPDKPTKMAILLHENIGQTTGNKKLPEIRLRAVSNLARAETQHNFTNIV